MATFILFTKVVGISIAVCAAIAVVIVVKLITKTPPDERDK